MKKILVIAIATLVSVGLVVAAQKAPAANPQVERGRYLVESVAMCGECHSPRDAEGQLDHARWLSGAPIWFSAVIPEPDWAFRAPPLAGLGSFTEADMTMVLEKGLQPTGRPIRPPMHVYHMTHDDAMAIVAYLRSVPPAKY